METEKYLLEEWRDIPGFAGLYQVSNFGFVRSLNYKKLGVVKLLKPQLSSGYLRVFLHKDGKYYPRTVHSLVMLAFVGPPEPLKPHINHIDENKTNNVLWNLEYCDRKYNRNFGTVNERLSKKFAKPILQYTTTGVLVKEWSSQVKAAKALKICASTISLCCNNKVKTAGGYIWKHKG